MRNIAISLFSLACLLSCANESGRSRLISVEDEEYSNIKKCWEGSDGYLEGYIFVFSVDGKRYVPSFLSPYCFTKSYIEFSGRGILLQGDYMAKVYGKDEYILLGGNEDSHLYENLSRSDPRVFIFKGKFEHLKNKKYDVYRIYKLEPLKEVGINLEDISSLTPEKRLALFIGNSDND